MATKLAKILNAKINSVYLIISQIFLDRLVDKIGKVDEVNQILLDKGTRLGCQNVWLGCDFVWQLSLLLKSEKISNIDNQISLITLFHFV